MTICCEVTAMKKEKAMELFGKYPDIPRRLVDRVIEKGRIKVLVQDGASSLVRCSACGTLSDIPGVKHGQKLRCPACGLSLNVASNRFRWEQNHWRNDENFAVVIPVEGDENAYISVVKVCSYFFQGMTQPAADIIEYQRYIFTPRGDAVRFGKTVEWYEDGMRWYRMQGEWKKMARYAEPVYDSKVSQIYTLLNAEELEGTCLRHCMIQEMMSGGREWNYGIFDYLKFYQKHKGADRLIKIGLNKLVYAEFRKSSGLVDWKQTEPHRMLGLTRPEVRKLADGEIRLNERRWIKRVCPGLSPEMYDRLSPAINMGKSAEFEILADDGSITPVEALKYIVRQGAQMGDYIDYIEQCKALGYDIGDAMIRCPRSLKDAHERCTAAIAAIESERDAAKLIRFLPGMKTLDEKRKRYEFEADGLFIRLPKSASEIIAEGRILNHCVGGYAQRHMEGKLTIMFLRRCSQPDKPFFTVEVSNDLKIVQCRGLRNESYSKYDDVSEFYGLFQRHLDGISGKIRIRKGA